MSMIPEQKDIGFVSKELGMGSFCYPGSYSP